MQKFSTHAKSLAHWTWTWIESIWDTWCPVNKPISKVKGYWHLSSAFRVNRSPPVPNGPYFFRYCCSRKCSSSPCEKFATCHLGPELISTYVSNPFMWKCSGLHLLHSFFYIYDNRGTYAIPNNWSLRSMRCKFTASISSQSDNFNLRVLPECTCTISTTCDPHLR